MPLKRPMWTVCANTISKLPGEWVGTSWQFFDTEESAQACYDAHVNAGNCPTKRPFHMGQDLPHLCIIDQMEIKSEHPAFSESRFGVKH